MAEKKKKFKVLIIHNYYQIPGGEDTVVANEKEMLEQHGNTVILYSRNNSELTEFSGVRKALLPLSTVFNLRTYREVKKIIKEKKIDIVHVHNTLNLISPAVYYAALSCKVPVIQTIHNFRLLCPGATFYRDGHICEECAEHGLKCSVKHSCYRKSKLQTIVCAVNTWIHRMTGVYGKINYICLTEFNKEKLLMLKQIKRKQVYVKPNFVAGGDSELVPSKKNQNQFIFAGRIDKLKGIDILLKAWKIMGTEAPRLIICGTGPMENWCREYIEVNRLLNVEMRGFLPNDDAKQLIAESKALILPTQWYEGFPMTIVEAYSVNTPVIGSDIGNVKSVITPGVTGELFEMGSSEQLVMAVKRCMEHGEYVFRTVNEMFSMEKNYKTMMSIYTEVCKGIE